MIKITININILIIYIKLEYILPGTYYKELWQVYTYSKLNQDFIDLQELDPNNN